MRWGMLEARGRATTKTETHDKGFWSMSLFLTVLLGVSLFQGLSIFVQAHVSIWASSNNRLGVFFEGHRPRQRFRWAVDLISFLSHGLGFLLRELLRQLLVFDGQLLLTSTDPQIRRHHKVSGGFGYDDGVSSMM